MEKLKLIKPTIEYKEQVLQAVQEFFDDNSNFYGSSGLKNFLDNYDGWLEYLKQNESKESVELGRVPAKQFILIRELDNKLIGFIQTRLELNEGLLQHGGHIGYSIRPSERRKNYATAQLFSVFDLYNDLGVEKVLLTCDKTNIGSAKTIQKCGGVLENEIIDPDDGELLQRYRIEIKKGIEEGNVFFENIGFNIEMQ